MDTSRIKIKIGEHEFEAEGPTAIVKEQFEAFKEIISTLATKTTVLSSTAAVQKEENKILNMNLGSKELDKVMHVDGRVVSLTAIPPSIEDAALLVMLGHRDLRDNFSVTGQEIGDGLAQSGRSVSRVDRVMETAIEQSLVLKTGVKRSTRYRLTNQGLAKAVGIAKELIASVA